MYYILARDTYWQPFADALHEALTKNQVECKVVSNWRERPNEVYILFCMHETNDLPKRFIGYNFEQLNVCVRPSFVQSAKKALYVWDFSELNLPFYSSIGVKARFVPYGFTETDIKIPSSDLQQQRTTDVMFLGSPSARRDPILQQVKDTFTSFISCSCYGKNVVVPLTTCRVGINMHYKYIDQRIILEVARIVPMLANGLAVVSERGDDKWYTDRLEPVVYYVDKLDDVCSTIKQALEQGPKHHDTLAYLRETFSYAKFVEEVANDLKALSS